MSHPPRYNGPMPQRAYRFRFYPNAEQSRTLARIFGTARWVWNQCLA